MSWQPSQGQPQTGSEQFQKQAYEANRARYSPQAQGSSAADYGAGGGAAGLLTFLIFVLLVGAGVFATFRFDLVQRIRDEASKGTVDGRVTAAGVNVRTGPTTMASSVGTLGSGMAVRIECVTVTGWFRLLEPYRGQFVFARYVKPAEVPRRC